MTTDWWKSHKWEQQREYLAGAVSILFCVIIMFIGFTWYFLYTPKNIYIILVPLSIGGIGLSTLCGIAKIYLVKYLDLKRDFDKYKAAK